MSLHIRKYLFLALPLLFLLLSFELSRRVPMRQLELSKEQTAINFRDSFTEHFHLGQKRFISALLWIEFALTSDIDRRNKGEFTSWLYLRLMTLTKLDPYFLEAYTIGGQFLSVAKDDPQAAALLFERGLTYYPDDFWLNYYAASTYATDLKNYKRAIELYEHIKFHPIANKQIPYLSGVILKLHARSGADKEMRLQIAKTMYEQAPEGSRLKEFLKKKMMKLQTTK